MSESYKAQLLDFALIDEPVPLDGTQECKGVMNLEGITWGLHFGIGPIYTQHVRNHGMVILRQPEQRLLSAWNNDYHSWPFDSYGRKPHNISEFALAVGGCSTKMMARPGGPDVRDPMFLVDLSGGACGDPVRPTEEESARAIDSLREGFPFVGILEQYDLSICLLHAMYGGTCRQIELEVAHSDVSVNKSQALSLATSASAKASTHVSSWYDTSVLDGWVDEVDGALYTEGKRIFEQLLELYGLNDAVCQQICWGQAQ